MSDCTDVRPLSAEDATRPPRTHAPKTPTRAPWAAMAAKAVNETIKARMTGPAQTGHEDEDGTTQCVVDKGSVGGPIAANGLHGDALIRALMETINRLEIQMTTMAEELKKEKGRSEVLQMDLELTKIHREAQGKPLGSGRHVGSVLGCHMTRLLERQTKEQEEECDGHTPLLQEDRPAPPRGR